MKKASKKNTSAPHRSAEDLAAEKAEKELVARKELHDAKVAEVQAEAKALDELSRQHVLNVINKFALDKAELDAFYEVFQAMPGNTDIAKLLVAAGMARDVNMDNFQTKLLRMGLL